MHFIDAVSLTGTRETADGYLVADVRTARTGIQLYAGSEVGKPDRTVVRVYRPADQVFSKASMASFAHKPVTNDHPDEAVTADNWKSLAVGSIGDEIAKDGEFVRVPLIVMDKSAIADIKAGKRELSAGYTCDLDFTPGKSPDGEDYDAFQKDIRINHVAIVQHGRAGSQARIGDDAVHWGVSPVTYQTADERNIQMDLRKILVDGLQVETTDAGATAITKLQNDLASSASKLVDATKSRADAETAHKSAIAAKDEEIGTLKADLVKAKDAAPKPADLDKLVSDRVALITTAKAIHADLNHEGLSDADIRKAVVTAKLGDEAVKDAPEAEITGMFKALAKDAKPNDPMRDALLNRDNSTVKDDAEKAYQTMVADLHSAHRPKSA